MIAISAVMAVTRPKPAAARPTKRGSLRIDRQRNGMEEPPFHEVTRWIDAHTTAAIFEQQRACRPAPRIGRWMGALPDK